MATSVYTDFKVYNAEFQAGLWEGISQFVSAFNGASNNAIRLVTKQLEGHYAKDAFFRNISDFITRRDISATTAATAVKMTQEEYISVKINRKIGPAEVAIDAIRKISKDQREISFILGEMTGQKKAQDLLNTSILGAEAAIEGVGATLNYDGSAGTITTAKLVSTLALMGDMASQVVAWVMHSKPYFDLVAEQIAAKITNVADRVVYGASPATLNRPVVISDIPALTDAAVSSAASVTYNTLGLVANGCVATESEQSDIVSEVVTGLENLVFRMQGEYAFNVGIKGFQWDITNGGANPTDASIATTSNWDQVAADIKGCAGVRCVTT